MIHVCSLARLHATVEKTGARHIVTFIRESYLVRRPSGVALDNHLLLAVDDISMPLEGHTVPATEHVEALIRFVRGWDRATPLVIHCFAGISRSTAGAFVTVCALNPQRDEVEIAQALRTASPTATPNARIVEIADQLLGRGGRMRAAVDAIGRGAEALEAAPFRLEIR
ncbi:MAG TPA: protein-tyrosine phosphatase family protein [Xanthobacteraceae bacterium]|nr:protein-tyrosine phosphatase family protein [Xanthobacteraceae bacterium]